MLAPIASHQVTLLQKTGLLSVTVEPRVARRARGGEGYPGEKAYAGKSRVWYMVAGTADETRSAVGPAREDM